MKKYYWIILLLLLSFCKGTNTNLNIISMNIRYDNPADGDNIWSNRKPLVAGLMHSKHPDVIGMQEVTFTQLMDLEVLLPEYSRSGVGRDDGDRKGEYAAIFYKKERFRLLEESTFWLSDTPARIGSISWGAHLPRVVSWVKLEDKRARKVIFVFNTHYSHVSDSARTQSSKLLVSKIQDIAGGYPVIMTGDFNFTATAEGYKVITGSRSDENRLYDAQSITQSPHFGGNSTYNGFGKSEDDEKIDFIFVNDLLPVIRHGIFLEKEGALYISDHYPVFAELEYRK